MPSPVSLFLSLKVVAGEAVPPAALDTLTKTVLGALVAVSVIFGAWVYRDITRDNRAQRATVDALNAEFRRDVIPLMTRCAEALERAAAALDAAASRGARPR